MEIQERRKRGCQNSLSSAKDQLISQPSLPILSASPHSKVCMKVKAELVEVVHYLHLGGWSSGRLAKLCIRRVSPLRDWSSGGSLQEGLAVLCIEQAPSFHCFSFTWMNFRPLFWLSGSLSPALLIWQRMKNDIFLLSLLSFLGLFLKKWASQFSTPNSLLQRVTS